MGISGSVAVVGSLSGTSATFSGGITSKETETTRALVLNGRDSDNLARIDFFRADTTTFIGRIQMDNGTTSNMSIRAQGALQLQTGGSTNRLVIDSTGAATFSSNLVAINGNGLTEFKINNNTSEWELYMPSGSTDLRLYRGTDKVAFLANGNVGIGTSSPQAKLHVANSASAVLLSESSSVATIIGTNAAGNASQELSLRGFPLTFTGNGGGGSEAMRITSGGNVGIGTSSPTTRLEVSSSDLNNIFVTNPTTSGATTGSGIGFKAYNGTSVTQSAGIILTSSTWSFGTYSANQLSLGSDGTGGLALRTANSAPITFFTGGATAGVSTERMRITSGGNVLIGTTSTANATKLTVIENVSGNGAYIENSAGSGYGLQVNISTNSASNFIFKARSTGVDRFIVRDDGLTIMQTSYANAYRINDTGGGWVTLGMQNSERWSINYLGRFSGYGSGTLTTDVNGFITASSDRNLKDIIKPVENVLDKVMEFEPVYFKWNDKTDLDKENVYISTIAQSIEKSFPEAVGKMADGTLTVQDRAVMAILVKAIQEQQAQIEELKQEIETLKAN
jgi:hypothetical protein